MLYKITWKAHGYANSYVRANSKEEAIEKADEREDENFEVEYPDDAWLMDEIHEVEEKE